MVGELPACLCHLDGFGGLGPVSLEGLDGLEWQEASWSLKALLESTAAISATQPTFHLTFSGGRNLGINSFQLPAYSWLDQPVTAN